MLGPTQLKVMWVLVLLLVLLVYGRAEAHTQESIIQQKYTLKRLSVAMEWKHGVPRGWLTATCEQESRWKLRQRSVVGALGVCQIMPHTFIWLVREFQRDHGLAPDGIIGPRTWAALHPDRLFTGYRSVEGWLFDPAENMEWAARYIVWLIENYGRDASLTFAMYYAGAGHEVLRYVLQTRLRLEKIRGHL